MNPLILAIQFLTPLPAGKVREVSHEEVAKTVLFFPFVGILQGLILFGAAHFIYKFFSFDAASGLVLLLWILVTGALHLDGLADTIDGLIGGRDKKEALQIMRKGNTGPFGMTALFMVLLLKYLSINSLSLTEGPEILFVVPLIGKTSIVYLNYLIPYAREGGGLGKAFVEGTDGPKLLFNILITLYFLSLLIGYRGLFAFLAVILFISAAKVYLKRKIGGVTGDTMGAASELSEVVFLVGMLI